MKNSKQSLLSYELELYKQMYDEENNYRNQFSDRAFKSITIIISLVCALIWLTLKYSSIYEEQCCYVRCVNFILLICCFAINVIIIFCFFKMLYGYKETRPSPDALFYLIEEYKSQTLDENDIIIATKESLSKSYIDAAINNSKENEKRIKLFDTIYKFILADITIVAICFIIEVFI